MKLLDQTRKIFKKFLRKFFKIRYVLCCPDYYSFHDTQNKLFHTVRFKDLPIEKYEPIIQQLSLFINKTIINRRLENDDIDLYLAIDNENGNIAGYYWSIHPHKASVWHDNFSVDKETALLFNAFTFPSYRRRGIYSLLLASSHNHVVLELGIKDVFTIVEKDNIASLQANTQFGLEIAKKNYLIKFMGKNILSIFYDHGGIKILYVYKNQRCHRF